MLNDRIASSRKGEVGKPHHLLAGQRASPEWAWVSALKKSPSRSRGGLVQPPVKIRFKIRSPWIPRRGRRGFPS